MEAKITALRDNNDSLAQALNEALDQPMSAGLGIHHSKLSAIVDNASAILFARLHVEDQLPPWNVEVLVELDDGSYHTGWLDHINRHGYWWVYIADGLHTPTKEVSAWCPFPQVHKAALK